MSAWHGKRDQANEGACRGAVAAAAATAVDAATALDEKNAGALVAVATGAADEIAGGEDEGCVEIAAIGEGARAIQRGIRGQQVGSRMSLSWCRYLWQTRQNKLSFV